MSESAGMCSVLCEHIWEVGTIILRNNYGLEILYECVLMCVASLR